jgi:hypothetical protein
MLRETRCAATAWSPPLARPGSWWQGWPRRSSALADPELGEQFKVLRPESQRLAGDTFVRFVREESRKWTQIASALEERAR